MCFLQYAHRARNWQDAGEARWYRFLLLQFQVRTQYDKAGAEEQKIEVGCKGRDVSKLQPLHPHLKSGSICGKFIYLVFKL